jgi:hypothetical protein
METGKVESQYSGFIIIRIARGAELASESMESLRSYAAEGQLHGIEKLLDSYDIKDTRPIIRALPPKEIRALERQVTQPELAPLHSLTSYWKLDIRHVSKKADEIVRSFNALDEVDIAYRELEATDPVVNSADDPYNASQNYQDPAPVGIDARWAWTQLNGEGADVGFVDLEQGWFLNHEDYASKSLSLLYGDNRDGIGTYVGNHGTAVLGEVCADDNTVGVVGIAPSVSSVNVTSHWDTASSSSGNVADAIVGALPTLQPGDVLLLEIQKGFLPTETDVADFDAIRLAVALGIIVVEAAGNGGFDLDNYTDGGGNFVLNRGSVDFRDSGAIVVGASLSSLPHNRIGFSNFGSRIDCYAWGENVTTAGYGDLDNGGGDNNRTYTSTFGGTSSASPIVSGAAVILQGLYKANTPGRLSPARMRELLSNPATGTAQGPDVAGHIGVMPDLRSIIENTLELPRLVTMIADNGDFGNVCVGSFKDMTLVLSNSGNARLRVTNITSSSAEFVLPSVLSYPVVIEAGTSLHVPLRLQPTGFGPKISTITVFSDNPNGAKHVDVSGRAPSGKLVITGSTCIGGVKACCVGERILTLANTGHCPLHVAHVGLVRPGKYWKLVNNPFPATLHPGARLDILIRYKAEEKCPRAQGLVIKTDDPECPEKTLDLLAYTVWQKAPSKDCAECGCSECCCDRGCTPQSLDACCFDEDCAEEVDHC